MAKKFELCNIRTGERTSGHRIGKTKAGKTIVAYAAGWQPCGGSRARQDRDGNYVLGATSKRRAKGLGASDKPKSAGQYVHIGSETYSARSVGAQKAMARAGLRVVPISRWDRFSWSDTALVLHRVK